MAIESLARKECSNYFDGTCLKHNIKCWVAKARCGYFETIVIPGIKHIDHPNHNTYKNVIQNYRDTIQYPIKTNNGHTST